MADLLLAIDAGGTAVKAAVFDREGRLVAMRPVDVRTLHRPNGWVEREPEAFWLNTAAAIRALLGSGIPAERIAAVACTGFGNGIFLVDADGRGTREGIVSVDHRAQPLVEAFRRDGTADRIEAISGNRIWGGQTLMQLAWLGRNEPDTVANTRWALPCKDFLRLRLTGEATSDPSDTSGGGLLDVAAGTYSPDLLGLAGIPEFAGKLPPLLPNSAVAGTISREAGEATGLRPGTPVATAMMDVGASTIGAGVIGSDMLSVIAGTWSINGVETQHAAGSPPPILQMIHRDGACRLVADGSPTSAGNLAWYLGQAAGGTIDLAEANRLVAASPVETRRCHFLPFINGPTPRRGAFLGLVNGDDRASMLRAIFEGIAFQHRRHCETVLGFVAPREPRSIRLSGGAAKSEVWTGIFADTSGLAVETCEAEEPGALGAALCAAVAAGFHADLPAAVAAMCRVGRVTAPRAALRDYYDGRYQEFLTLDERLADLFEEPGRRE